MKKLLLSVVFLFCVFQIIYVVMTEPEEVVDFESSLSPADIWESGADTLGMRNYLYRNFTKPLAEAMLVPDIYINPLSKGRTVIEHVAPASKQYRRWVVFYVDAEGLIRSFKASRPFWTLIIRPPDASIPMGELKYIPLADDQQTDLDTKIGMIEAELLRWVVSEEEYQSLKQRYSFTYSKQEVQELKSRVGVLKVMRLIMGWHMKFCNDHSAFDIADKPDSLSDAWILYYADYFEDKRPFLAAWMRYRDNLWSAGQILFFAAILLLCIKHFGEVSVVAVIRGRFAHEDLQPPMSFLIGVYWRHWWSFLRHPHMSESDMLGLLRVELSLVITQLHTHRLIEEAQRLWKEYEGKILGRSDFAHLQGLFRTATDSATALEVRRSALQNLRHQLTVSQQHVSSVTSSKGVRIFKTSTSRKRRNGLAASVAKKSAQKRVREDVSNKPKLLLLPSPDSAIPDDPMLLSGAKIFVLGKGYTIKNKVKERLCGIMEAQGAVLENIEFFNGEQWHDVKSVARRHFDWCIVLTQKLGHAASDHIKIALEKRGDTPLKVIEIDGIGAARFREALIREVKIARAKIRGEQKSSQQSSRRSSNGSA